MAKKNEYLFIRYINKKLDLKVRVRKRKREKEKKFHSFYSSVCAWFSKKFPISILFPFAGFMFVVVVVLMSIENGSGFWIGSTDIHNVDCRICFAISCLSSLRIYFRQLCHSSATNSIYICVSVCVSVCFFLYLDNSKAAIELRFFFI